MQELLNRAANTIDEQAETIRAQAQWIFKAKEILQDAYDKDLIFVKRAFLEGPKV